MKFLKTVILVFLVLAFAFDYASAIDRKYEGKVVDSETHEPLKGVGVVCDWRQTRYGSPAGPSDRLLDPKYAITDENGEWELMGPIIDSGVTGVKMYLMMWVTDWVNCDFYKPGYAPYRPGMVLNGFYFDNFVAWEYKIGKYAGIMLNRPGGTKEEQKAYWDAVRENPNSLPLLLVADPGKRLRELEFPFTASEYSKRGSSARDLVFDGYTVVGLQRLKTLEEREKVNIEMRKGPYDSIILELLNRETANLKKMRSE